MKKMLVTGGTVFVSRSVAEYFAAGEYEVYVLNRGSRLQSEGVKLINADRHNLGDALKKYHFDVIVDVTAYTAEDVNLLLDALESYDDYILISSSAVYPEYCQQPFTEETSLGVNKYWGKYGTDKIEAEEALLKRNPNAYILRPPYLYGSKNNIYREAFVFDCAMNNQKFYLPQDGNMKLQFLHVHDLCRFMDIILKEKPEQNIFNVGNKEAVSIRKWVELCYCAVGREAEFVNVYDDIEQRNYFPFYHYEYYLDVSKQYELIAEVQPLETGLKEAFDWYKNHQNEVLKKPLFEFIENHLAV